MKSLEVQARFDSRAPPVGQETLHLKTLLSRSSSSSARRHLIHLEALVGSCNRMAARREHKRYRDEEPTAAESSEAVIDFGATPMWHPPASYQQESSVRQALGPDEALKDNSTASISSSTQDHGDSVAAKSILHLHSLSFEALETPYRKDPATTTPVNRRDAVHRVMATDSEVFAQRYQRRMLDFNIDMYDIDETQIASVDKDDGRMYHIGHKVRDVKVAPELELMSAFKGGDTFSGTFATDRPLPREAQAMVDQMLDKPNIVSGR